MDHIDLHLDLEPSDAELETIEALETISFEEYLAQREDYLSDINDIIGDIDAVLENHADYLDVVL